MRRVMFLDFDGVLNNLEYLTMLHKDGDGREWWSPEMDLDASKIRLLNDLVGAVGDLEIVISSSWRIGRSVEELRDILESRGFLHPHCIIDKTGHDFHDGKRGNEIEAWIERQEDKPDRFVIVDDDVHSMIHIMDHVVQTSFKGAGLTEKHLEEIITILE